MKSKILLLLAAMVLVGGGCAKLFKKDPIKVSNKKVTEIEQMDYTGVPEELSAQFKIERLSRAGLERTVRAEAYKKYVETARIAFQEGRIFRWYEELDENDVRVMSFKQVDEEGNCVGFKTYDPINNQKKAELELESYVGEIQAMENCQEQSVEDAEKKEQEEIERANQFLSEQGFDEGVS